MLILCVLKISCGIYVLVRVLESVLVCGLFVDSFCAVFVYLRFWCVYSMVQVTVYSMVQVTNCPNTSTCTME
jgi:hypothetical protein